MSEDYKDWEDFDIDEDPEEGMLSFEEMKGICERHIKSGHDPYDEEEFSKIVSWAEETIMNNSILNLVLDGTLDIVFNQEKLDEIGEDGLLFALTKEAKEQLEEAEKTISEENPNGFLNLNFDDEEEA